MGIEKRIVDLRKKEKYILDDEYLNGMAKLCGWQGTIVYNSLCRHANFTTQECFPSIQLMMTQHNVSRKTILKGLLSLEKRKVILIEKRRTNDGKWLNNKYTLLDKSLWDYTQVPVGDLAKSCSQVPVGTPPSPRGVLGEKNEESTVDGYLEPKEKVSQVPVGDTKVKETNFKDTHYVRVSKNSKIPKKTNKHGEALSSILGSDYTPDFWSPKDQLKMKRVIERSLGLRGNKWTQLLFGSAWDFKKLFSQFQGYEYIGAILIDEVAKNLALWYEAGETRETIKEMQIACFQSEKAQKITVTPTSVLSNHTYDSWKQGKLVGKKGGGVVIS